MAVFAGDTFHAEGTACEKARSLNLVRNARSVENGDRPERERCWRSAKKTASYGFSQIVQTIAVRN